MSLKYKVYPVFINRSKANRTNIVFSRSNVQTLCSYVKNPDVRRGTGQDEGVIARTTTKRITGEKVATTDKTEFRTTEDTKRETVFRMSND